jgi:hypothetical protein
MGSHSSDIAPTGRSLPPTASQSIKRQGFWALIAMYFERGLYTGILSSQHTPNLGMDLASGERELFVFTGPFSPLYQESDLQGKDK